MITRSRTSTSPSIARRWKVAVPAFAVLLTAALAGCSGSEDVTVYNIGMIAPLSGENAVVGNDILRPPLEMAIDHLNKSGDLHKKMALKIYDSQADPQKAVTGLNQLIAQDHIVAAQTLFSSNILAEAPVSERAKLPVINAGASAPNLVGISDYLLNLVPLGGQQLEGLMPYVADKLKLTRWAIVYSDETLGQGLTKTIEDKASKAGVEVVGKVSVGYTQTNFQSTIATLKGLNADTVFLALGNAGEVPTFIQQARAAGITGRWLTYNGVVTQDTAKEKTADGIMYVTQDINVTDPADAATKEFVDAYKAKTGNAPLPVQATMYSSILMIGEALKSLEGSGDKVTGESLLATLHDISTFAELPGGTLKLLSDGTVSSPLAITTVTGGNQTVVHRIPVDTSGGLRSK